MTRRGCWCRGGCPGSVIHDRDAVLARVRRLLGEGVVETYDGTTIPMRLPRVSCCMATRPARWRLRARSEREIEASGGTIRPISALVGQARGRISAAYPSTDKRSWRRRAPFR